MSNTFSSPMSAQLMRVLAEAAEGCMGRGKVWVVAARNVDDAGCFRACPFISKEAADAAAKQGNVNSPNLHFHVFGPFDTPIPEAVGRSVEPMSTLTIAAGTDQTFTLQSKWVDAVFFSPAAVIKFALPYYQKLYSPAVAEQIYKDYLSSPYGALVHMPWSEYADVEADGGLQIDGTNLTAAQVTTLENFVSSDVPFPRVLKAR